MGAHNSKRKLRDRIDMFLSDPDIVRLIARCTQAEHYISIDYTGVFHHLCESHGYKLYYTQHIRFDNNKHVKLFKRDLINRMNQYLAETYIIINVRNRRHKMQATMKRSNSKNVIVIKDHV